VAAVTVSGADPHSDPALAMRLAVPAFCTVIITPSSLVCRLPMAGSEMLQVMAAGSMPLTVAGTWKRWTPSNAEYIGENRISIWLLAQLVTAPTAPGCPLPPVPPVGDVPGDSDLEQALLAAVSSRARQRRR
jgi:hypothetical protein